MRTICPIAAPPPEPGDGLGEGLGLGEGDGLGDGDGVGLADVPMPPLTPPQEARTSTTAEIMRNRRTARMLLDSIRRLGSELPKGREQAWARKLPPDSDI